MTQSSKDSSEQRIRQLEKDVADIKRLMNEVVRQLKQSQEPETSVKSADAPIAPKPVSGESLPKASSSMPAPGSGSPSRQPMPEKRSSPVFNGEVWLNRIGIGLLLFGLAFLFKYSIDQGWLTPWVRIVFGLFLGGFLLYFGASKYRERKQFSQVLLGGGIATLYITGFAAFQLYELVPHLLAFVFMILVTVIAFFLAVQQSRVALAIIGVLGGLLTPFLLYTGSGNLPGLLFYTTLIATGSGAIYLIRRWRLLLWVTFVGSWLVFIAVLVGGFGGEGSRLFNKWFAQGTVLYAWLFFGGLAAITPLAISFIERWQLRFGGQPSDPDKQAANLWQLYSMMIAAPLLTKSYSVLIWSRLSEETWGWIAIAFSLVYAGVAKLVWPMKNGEKVGYIHLLIATLLLTLGFCLVLDGNALLFTLAAQGTVMHYLARRFDDRGTQLRAHLLFLATILWLVYRIFDNVPGTAFFTAGALTDLVVIGCFLLSSFAFAQSGEVVAYRVATHFLWMGWLARELSAFDNGLALISIVWGLYGVILLLAGLRLDRAVLRSAGLLTLLIVVGKLFLLDLATVAAIWRILLFMGFGGAFLLLSYYFPRLWRSSSSESDQNSE